MKKKCPYCEGLIKVESDHLDRIILCPFCKNYLRLNMRLNLLSGALVFVVVVTIMIYLLNVELGNVIYTVLLCILVLYSSAMISSAIFSRMIWYEKVEPE